MTCDRVKQMMTDQLGALSETKAQLHSRILAYSKDEKEIRQIALQVRQLRA